MIFSPWIWKLKAKISNAYRPLSVVVCYLAGFISNSFSNKHWGPCITEISMYLHSFSLKYLIRFHEYGPDFHFANGIIHERNTHLCLAFCRRHYLYRRYCNSTSCFWTGSGIPQCWFWRLRQLAPCGPGRAGTAFAAPAISHETRYTTAACRE